MDNRMDFLDAIMESDVVGYHNFTLKYENDNKGKVVYCFTEGEDYKYYKSRLDAISMKESIFIDCKGREGVIEAIKLVESIDIYREDIIIGFVDRDYFQIEVPSNVLMTDYYSIESYYCRENSVKNILDLHCKLTNTQQLNLDSFNQFRDLHNQFVTQISFFSVWCYMQVLNTQVEKKAYLSSIETNDDENPVFLPNEYISLNKINLFNYIDMTLDSVNIPTLQSVEAIVHTSKKAFGNSKFFSDEEVNSMLSKISPSDMLLLIRGKFELQFLITFLNLKVRELNEKHSKKINQDLSDPLSLFSAYAKTSPKLREIADSVI